MANLFCINKSGKSVTIYDNVGSSNDVGTLYANELFTEHDIEGGHSVTFLSKSGSLSTGVIRDADIASGLFTPWTNYPISTFTENGTKYYVFRLRSASDYCPPYDKNDTKSAPSGTYVATPSGESGSSLLSWMEITHMGSSTHPPRISITDDYGTHNWAFINSGLDKSSSTSTIALYGNW